MQCPRIYQDVPINDFLSMKVFNRPRDISCHSQSFQPQLIEGMPIGTAISKTASPPHACVFSHNLSPIVKPSVQGCHETIQNDKELRAMGIAVRQGTHRNNILVAWVVVMPTNSGSFRCSRYKELPSKTSITANQSNRRSF